MQIAAAKEALKERLHQFVERAVLFFEPFVPMCKELLEGIFDDLLESVRPGAMLVARRALAGRGEHRGEGRRSRPRSRQGSGRRGKGKAGVVTKIAKSMGNG